MLKYTERTYKEVDYYEIERFINDNRNTPFRVDIIAEMELLNDSMVTITVDGKIDQYDKEQMEKHWESGECWGYGTVSALLNYLCSQGKVDKGDYLINISW